jgi:fluoroacetyl-CoA thioesterase
MNLAPGITLERAYTVTYDLTAAALSEADGSDTVALPAVWSTPDMIGKMDVVAAALVAPHLPDGQISVAARNEISHLAATPVGMRVRVRATLDVVDGRKLIFAVEAVDELERVGEGFHIRYVVDRARFESRVAGKAQP